MEVSYIYNMKGYLDTWGKTSAMKPPPSQFPIPKTPKPNRTGWDGIKWGKTPPIIIPYLTLPSRKAELRALTRL